MQNTEEFKAIASIIEYWNSRLIANTKFIASNLKDECILIVANESDEEVVTPLIGDKVKVYSLVDAKEGKLPPAPGDLLMVLTPLAIQQLFVELSGLGMKNGELAKAEVYEALLSQKAIKPEFTKVVYTRAKEIREKT